MEYAVKKIPVCNSVEELLDFLKKYPTQKFCLYLAYKNKEDWDKSTSRTYMNQVMDSLLYLPVNIAKDDLASIREMLRIAEDNQNIVAINITQPHKSGPVLKERFKGEDLPSNIDTLVKDEGGNLRPYDINAPSFVGWYKDEVGSFKNKSVVLLGAGGVGEPIARRIAHEHPKELVLVDKEPKEKLQEELASYCNVRYTSKLDDTQNNIVFINCAGKEGADDSSAAAFLEKHENKGFVFVDLRPQLDIEIVGKAKQLGWKAFTGHGMNARNDYVLLRKIAERANAKPLEFSVFKELVAKAS